MPDAIQYLHDPRLPQRVSNFFGKCLVHTKGQHAGKPFILLPWQQEIISDIYGTLRPDGLRRYRTAYIEIPRKAGKSTTIAGLALYELLFGERGGEIYICANSREQARILLGIAVDTVQLSPMIRDRLIVSKNSIYNPKTRSILKVLSRDAVTALGVNASMVIMDELLGAPDDALYNSMATSLGARQQPLMISITTAGFSRVSFCYQLHEYAEKVASGIVQDDSFYSKIYGIKDGEDWTSEEVWKKCNPSLGYTVSLDFLRSEYNRTKEFPQYETAFKTLYLNAWLTDDKGWLTDKQWMLCSNPELKIEDFAGEDCYAGLDLSSTQDLTALSLCFYRDSKFHIFAFGFCPEDNIKIRSRKDKVPYELWRKEGHLTATPGNSTDYEYIISKLIELSAKYNIAEIAVDRWNSSYLVTKLQEHGFNVVGFGQGFGSMSSAVKLFEREVLAKNVVHDANPVLRWCLSNVILKSDPAGNVKTDKSKSREKIDLVQASLMATERCSVGCVTGGVSGISQNIWA